MVEETQTVERTRLIISVSGKTAQQMAEEYGFDEKQLGYVTELLSEEYSDLWASLSVPGVEIVESCDGSTFYTIEGNANNACKQLSYAVGDRRILGYGTLAA